MIWFHSVKDKRSQHDRKDTQRVSEKLPRSALTARIRLERGKSMLCSNHQIYDTRLYFTKLLSMKLSNINVLVDAYNLELLQGTGVKTYGVSLIKALKILGSNIDILFSSDLVSKNSVVSEATFFDIYAAKQELDLIDKLTRISLSLKVALNSYSARRLNMSGMVLREPNDIVRSELLKYSGVINASRCYEIANLIFKILNWELKIKTSKNKVDIWHTTYPLPIKIQGAKKITTIHDLIPLKLPYATLDDKQFFYNLIENAIKSSEVIIAVSENTKKDILSIYNCDADKIVVTYQPIAMEKKLPAEGKVNDFLRKYKLTNKNYLLFVGSIEPKKNVNRLLDAYTLLNPYIPLVIVGKKGWLCEREIRKIESYSEMIWLDYVPSGELKYLYQGACCFIFPSLYEGFGLPVLEAMNCGCPVITSNVASLPEVCGDAALYVDPYNVEDIAEKMNMLLYDSDLQCNLAEAGWERVNLFSMDNYVTKLAQAYEKVL